MNSKNVQELMKKLGCTKIRTQPNGWIASTCPLAQWTHKGGHDNHPSFGIVVEDQQFSSYKCLACHERGTLRQLYSTIVMKGKKPIDGVPEFIEATDQLSVAYMLEQLSRPPGQWAAPVRAGGIELSYRPRQEELEEIAVDDTIPESELTRMVALPSEAMAWLTGPKIPVKDRINGVTPRGLTVATIEKFGLCWNPMSKRLVIPVRDVGGRLVSISSRAFYSWQKPKFSHGYKFRKQHYLYGEHLVVPCKTGILVEGNLDVPMLHQLGYTSTLSNMGSDLGKIQFEKICKWFEELIYVRDGDEAGKIAATLIAKQCAGIIPCRIVDLEDGWDPDDLSGQQAEALIGSPTSLQ